jgi:CBS domain-containing protein
MNASELVEGITVPAPVTVSKSDPVLLLGALLSSWDVSSVIVTDNNGKAIGAVYGYQLVAYLMSHPNREVLKRLRHPIEQVTDRLGLSQIPSVSHKESFDSILRKIAENRFGDVILTNESGLSLGILSLSQIIPCLALRKMKAALKVRDVASPLKLASEGQPLSNTLRYMMRNGIRRAVVKKNGDFYGLTDRELVRAFFSFRGLQSLSEDTKEFMTSSLGQLIGNQAKHLPTVNGDMNVHDAWQYLDGDPKACLIVDDDLIATPWDLVMKPFLEDKLLAQGP